VSDLIGRPRILDAGGEPIRDTQALLDLAQRQHPSVKLNLIKQYGVDFGVSARVRA
jgi:hypothetical protein